MMYFIIIIIVGIILSAILKSGNQKKTQRKTHGKNNDNERLEKIDYGTFIRIVSYEKLAGDEISKDKLYSDVPKGKRHLIRVTDALHDRKYIYDINKRIWKNGISPFYYRAPSSFLSMLISTWEELNGPLPERKKREKITDVDAESSILELPMYDPNVLVDLPNEIPIKNQAGEIYAIDLSKLSCTCADFIKRRAGFQHNDIRRVCKHIAQAIIQQKLNAKLTKENFIRMFIKVASDKKKGIPIFQKIIHVKITEKIKGPGEFYILSNESNFPWIDVVVFLKTTYYRQGYNFDEKRWAYNYSPFPHGTKTKYNLAIQETIQKLITK